MTFWKYHSSVQFSRSVQILVTPWTAARQSSLSINNSRNLLKLTSFESVTPPTFSSSVVSFSSCLRSVPASGSFQMTQFFTSGGQSNGVSASVLPMNIKDWFLLGWTDWMSLQSKGLSRIFSNTTDQKHQFFGAQLSFGEGNANPLHYSCLENPRDGRAWWVAIYGVAQSLTQLKWLSSSSTNSFLYSPTFTPIYDYWKKPWP